MLETSVALIVRQQAWFRAFVDCGTLSRFPTEAANSVLVNPPGVLRTRVLIGCGPIEYEVQPEFRPWFGHGEEPYPVLQCPSIGPKGAGLYARAAPSKITANKDEAVVLIEVSIVQPVEPALAEEYLKEQQLYLDQATALVVGPALASVQKLCTETERWLEQAIGLYVVYQYPIVWQPLTVCPLVGFINLETQTLRHVTLVMADNFIPFRLDVKEKLRDGHLVDDALVDLHRLSSFDLHLPLVFLQRSLWQGNPQVRFLEGFWIIEHLARQCTVADNARQEREELHGAIEECVRTQCPQHLDRVHSLKATILELPLKRRLAGYCALLGVDCNDDLITRMLKLRNDLSHGGKIDADELAIVELETRVLVRKVMEKELATRGIRFGGGATGHHAQ